MDIQVESSELKRLINEMHDVTNTWSVTDMVQHVWQKAQKAAMPDGFVLVPKEQIKGYFSHDGDNYQVHKSLNQAKSDAQRAIDYYSDRLADGDFHPESDGNYQDIGFGVVLGRSDYSLLRIITQQDIDNGECEYPVGTEILELHLDEAMIEAAEVGE